MYAPGNSVHGTRQHYTYTFQTPGAMGLQHAVLIDIDLFKHTVGTIFSCTTFFGNLNPIGQYCSIHAFIGTLRKQGSIVRLI